MRDRWQFALSGQEIRLSSAWHHTQPGAGEARALFLEEIRAKNSMLQRTFALPQAARANEITAEQGLAGRVSFQVICVSLQLCIPPGSTLNNHVTRRRACPQVADALAQPFSDGEFDFVWSMESGEHMPDKEQFVSELVRVCAPGGKIIIVTWCHRVLTADRPRLSDDEQSLLKRICEAYHLPAWCSLADYERIFEQNGLQVVRTADWSEEVTPFWSEVIKTALTPAGVGGLVKAGWGTIKVGGSCKLCSDSSLSSFRHNFEAQAHCAEAPAV